MSQFGIAARALRMAIDTRRAKVVVVGQGIVGVPEAMAIAGAGFSVVGLDRDAGRIEDLLAGQTPSPDVPPETLQHFLAAGNYRPTTDICVLDSADVVVICVPTPLTAAKDPDLSLIEAAALAIGAARSRPRLTILASTVPPGTTREVVLPRLVGNEREVGRDVFLAFAPERLDPGNHRFTLASTTRLVGGVTPACQWLAEGFYQGFVESIKSVSAPEIAELAKSVENSFRFLNISFANEVALLCDRLGYSVWDVVDAAATKPFAFMAHFPGPGVGGSCIPVVPHYLQHAAERAGLTSRLIDTSVEINDEMPRFVVDKLSRLLADRGRNLAGARILVVGVTYKPNVADTRESPAIPIIRVLRDADAEVSYCDPYVPALTVDDATLESLPSSIDVVASSDAVLLLTLHDRQDRSVLLDNAPFVFDTRNALGTSGNPKVIPL